MIKQRLNVSNAVHSERFPQAWRDFQNQHADWLRQRQEPGEPLYCLPKRLSQSLAKRCEYASILNVEDLHVELQLYDFCRRYHTHAVWQDWPAWHMFLDHTLTRTKSQANSPPSPKGWIGLLISEPLYLADRDRLRSVWNQLSDSIRTVVHLRCSAENLGSPAEASDVERFNQVFREFCRRWNLSGLPTWDIPEPDVLGLRVLANRGYNGGDWGFGPADIGQHEAYAQIAEIAHCEAVVRRRYTTCTSPKYHFATRLEEALAASMKLSVDRVHRLRIKLAACHRGQRPKRLR